MSITSILCRASIAGTVTDALTGLPIIGAIVSIEGTSLFSETGRDGFYYFTDLSAATYSLTVTAPGFGSRYGSTTTHGIVVHYNSEGVPVFDGNANVALPPTCIQGVVRRLDNNAAIAGANISVICGEEHTISALNGSFTLTGLLAGNPGIRISAPGFITVVQKVNLIAGATTHMNINLEQ